MNDFNIARFLMVISAIVLGITVHEWAHAITADRLGDDTPRAQGRVTLWPLAHLDLFGSIFMVLSSLTGFGIGWGKPVQTNPRNYQGNRRIADSLVSFAGPLSNLVIAIVFSLLVRFHAFPDDDPFAMWAVVIVHTNILLFVFNLLPLYPLDGSHLLRNALPPRAGDAYIAFMQQFGMFLFLALVLTRSLGVVLGPVVNFVDSILYWGM